MNFKPICLLGTLVCTLFGLAFLLVPLEVAAIYGMVDWNPGQLTVARLLGASMLYIAAALFVLRDLADRPLRRNFATAFAVVSAVAAVVSIHSVVTGATNAMMWSTVVIYGFFAIAWTLVAKSTRT